LVSTLVDMCSLKEYAGKTMGVISLQGEAQAKYIETQLMTSLSPTELEARKIVCGDAYAFQGDERDIIFLSMVAAPNERIGALVRETDKRRFNVAASRAKDQVVLFYTATLNDLNPDCMRHKLLEYYLNPALQVSEVDLNKCESQFERDVCQAIIDKGYKVIPQYKVAEYRIDLVVEGTKSQLAVECDGDEWHGIEQYERDVARQRILERCGWRFWRVRGHEYYHDPVNALQSLWKLLPDMSIRPLSAIGYENEVSIEEKKHEEDNYKHHFITPQQASQEQQIAVDEEAELETTLSDASVEESVEKESKTTPSSVAPTKSEVFNHPSQFFFELAHHAKEMNKFQPWERRLLFNIGKYLSRNWTVTEKMERQTLRLIDEARNSGLIQGDSEEKHQPENGTATLPRDFLFRVKKLEEEGRSIADIAAKFKVSAQSLQEAINQRQGEIDVLIGEVFKGDKAETRSAETISRSPEQLRLEELSVPGPNAGEATGVISKALETILSGLKDRQAQIVRLRFGLTDGKCHTLEEIGRNMNLSRERIRQIEEKAMHKLKHPSKKKQVETLTGLVNTSAIDLLNIVSSKGQKRTE